MRRNRLLILTAVLAVALPALAQEYRGRLRDVMPEEARSTRGIELRALSIGMWQEKGVRVFDARGQVEVVTDAGQITAKRAIVFFEEAYAQEHKKIIVRVYAEGDVVLWERGREIHDAAAYRVYETTGRFAVNAADRNIQDLKTPQLTPAYRRAVEAKAALLAKKPEPRPAPEAPETETPEAEAPAPEAEAPAKEAEPVKVAPVVVPPPEEGIVAEPEEEALRVRVYGLHSSGFKQHLFEKGDEVIAVLSGGVDIMLAGRDDKEFEITADNVVLWFHKRRDGTGLQALSNLTPKAVYAEGNVVLYRNRLRFTAPRLVHDFQTDRSLMNDVVAKSELANRDVPIYYRASVVRQVSRDLFVGYRAMISNSDSPHPNVYFTTKEFSINQVRGVETVDTPAGPRQQEVVQQQIVTAKENVTYVHGLPISYWPIFTKDLKNATFALRKLQVGQSSRMGTTVKSIWDLNDLGVPEVPGMEMNLLLDEFSRRGPGAGVDNRYSIDGGVGEFLGYWVNDTGIDYTGYVPPRPNRGRVHWIHRQTISEDTLIDFEFSWLSDQGILLEYFEEEAKTQKEQETYMYIKKQRDKWALTGLARWRINSFYDRTEYLPQLGFDAVGLSLLKDTFTFNSTNEVGNVRNRPSNDNIWNTLSHQIFRLDSENELALPLELGPIHFVPYALGRLSYFGETYHDGGAWRGVGGVGLRSSMPFSKIYDFYSRLFDINRVRHIMTPMLSYRNILAVSDDPSNLFQFDEVDTVHEREAITLGLRQRWQTKRGPTALAGELVGTRNVVDMLRLELDIDLFPHKGRDNDGKLWGDLKIDAEAYVTDTITFLLDCDYDVARGHSDILNAGYYMTHHPRLGLYVGYHYVRAGETDAVDVAWEYRATPRWDIKIASQYNSERRRWLRHEFTVRRFFQAWIMDVTFAVDGNKNDTLAAITFSPRGVPETNFQVRTW